MFKRLDSDPNPVTITVDGESICVSSSDTVAAALLTHGIGVFRSSTVGGEPRAPYCLMGVCHDCLVEIDGRLNQQACLIPVRSGMMVRRHIKKASAR